MNNFKRAIYKDNERTTKSGQSRPFLKPLDKNDKNAYERSLLRREVIKYVEVK